MDNLTKQIIAVLRRDGRISFVNIARNLNVSRDNVAARVVPLIESGQIRVVAALHPQVLGLTVSAHLSISVSGDVRPVIQQLEKLSSAVFISIAAGAYHVIAETRHSCMSELSAEVSVVRSLRGVVEVQVLIYDRVLTSFLHREQPNVLSYKFDEIDIALISLLQNDGRASYSDLSQKVGLSISGCRTRVLHLLRSGVIQIGAIKQRSNMIDDFIFGIGINVNGDIDAAARILSSGWGLEFLARTVGRFDVLATVSFSSLRDFNQLVSRLMALKSVTYCEQWLHVQILRERYEYPIEAIELGTAARA
ncbi:Lrp/AsnC family transcriptional regulator [Burkholderia humptydooensis]|uniref:Lrp/AsnC family transcriptional regulator n=1 Tax=Burkholderia humptydooensis TaxID=430531 RepID=A0A7T2U3Q2_9BURK|nr:MULTISPECIES: AsnC family transcriptional regulator [Burkholderia]QPS44949.1 Lrp/AsnC family transcriptional regulator [Burkholderia humptydooensis]